MLTAPSTVVPLARSGQKWKQATFHHSISIAIRWGRFENTTKAFSYGPAYEKNVEDVRSSAGDDAKLVATLLPRNIAEVFGENDPERRRAGISEIDAEDAVVHAPTGTVVGHDALDKFAGDLRSMHPHYVYTPSGEPQVLQYFARLAWGSGPRGEPPRYTGRGLHPRADG